MSICFLEKNDCFIGKNFAFICGKIKKRKVIPDNYKEVSMIMETEEMKNCSLCPRNCRADRNKGELGFCQMPSDLYIARAALHMWEEPCISGERGSGTVFFTGCSLGCVFCQNHQIAKERWGKQISIGRLKEIFLELQEQDAANINLVTAGHYLPYIKEALLQAKREGLDIPVVYNTGGYEKEEQLRHLEGLIDVYLPDFKYMDPDLSGKYSFASDYSQVAKKALREMVRQTGRVKFDEEGYLIRGVMVRHLILPGHTRDSMRILNYLHETYKDEIYISIMNQYTPVISDDRYPLLKRRVTVREYEKVLDYAVSLGIEQGFFQEGDTAEESFIPPFTFEGVEHRADRG